MEVIELLQVLDNVLDGFDNKSNIKYQLLKEQIENKISIIKHFIYYGFPVLNYTNQEQLDILYCLKFAGKIADIDNMINDILKNIYESSGYQVLLSNIPTIVSNIFSEDNTTVNAERMYDTLEVYVGEDNIESVFQVSSDTYLAKFQLDSEAKRIVNLIDNKMIGNNIIVVQYMAQILNFNDSIYMDGSMIYVESDCEKYEKEFKDIELLNVLAETEIKTETEPKLNDDYKYIEPLTPSKSIENIKSIEKPVEYIIDDIDDTSDIEVSKGVKGAEAPLADDGWKVYEKKSLIGTLFNNISNKFYTISRYFSNN